MGQINKLQSQPQRSRNHDTMVWEREKKRENRETCQFEAYGKLIITPLLKHQEPVMMFYHDVWWGEWIVSATTAPAISEPVSQVITNPHSIPGKHVTKWVKITSRTSQSSSICRQIGLWGQWQRNNCCFQGVFTNNSNKSNVLLLSNMLVLWIGMNLRSQNPSLHPICWAKFVDFSTAGLPQEREREVKPSLWSKRACQ